MYPTTSQQVTPEQLAACFRIIDETSGEIFYCVQSAHSDEEYTVHFAEGEDGGGHFTCTCRAGQHDVPCWHIRAAKAHDALQQEKKPAPLSTDERLFALSSYCTHEHLIKIKSKDGTLREYLPAGWRFYELSLRYEDANFSTELLFFDMEKNFCIVKCRLYLGADYEFSTKKVEATKSGPLNCLDKIETGAQARCCRLFGIGTEYALESDSGLEEATEGAPPPREEEKDTPTTGEAKLHNNPVTLKSVKQAVRAAGLAHNPEQWSRWKRNALGQDVPDSALTQEQIAHLSEATQHVKPIIRVS